VDCGGLEAGGREGRSHEVGETGEADCRQRRSVIAKYYSLRVSFHKFLINNFIIFLNIFLEY